MLLWASPEPPEATVTVLDSQFGIPQPLDCVWTYASAELPVLERITLLPLATDSE